ncbi:MAG: enoyl-CoA hydratase/isomerase family protein [Rhodomicrobium sp.]
MKAMIQQNPATLSLIRQGDVLTVRLNRPEARNAMSQTMLRELLDVLAEAEAAGVRIVVLRGSGGHFSAGADLHDMAQARRTPIAHETDPIARVNAAFGHVCAAYAQSPLAIVAVLEGAVMGGGFGLACCSDVAIALQTADFRLPETSLGLIPAQIAPFLVERLGYSEAKRIAVTGARFGADEAFRIGLVHKVCANGTELEAALAATLHQILACAPGALAETKKLLRRARFEDPASLVEHAAALFGKAARGEEGAEGLRAFAEKRKPSWAS